MSPMCPWCGDEADDTPELLPFPAGSDHVDMVCGGCEQPITVRRVVTITYACEKRVVKDIYMLGGVATEQDEPYLVQKLKQIKDEASE